MINLQMKQYDYFALGSENEYGEKISGEIPKGKVKMAVNIASQSIQDNVLYKDAELIGLTRNAEISDKNIIEIGGEKFKVLYVNTRGRYRQIVMRKM